jgi:hypothetical protein
MLFFGLSVRRKYTATSAILDEVAELKEMRLYPLDCSDIPAMKESERHTSRLIYKEFLDNLPPDIVAEMAKRRLEEIKAAGYEVSETAGVKV